LGGAWRERTTVTDGDGVGGAVQAGIGGNAAGGLIGDADTKGSSSGRTGSMAYPSQSSPCSISMARWMASSKSNPDSAAGANTATEVSQGENSAPERV